MKPAGPTFLRVREAAAILGISASAAYELVNTWLVTDGQTALPAVRCGCLLRASRRPLGVRDRQLRRARTTVADDLEGLDGSIPTDRREEWDDAHQRLPAILSTRYWAEQALAQSRAHLDEVSRRRWARRYHQAIATAEREVASAGQEMERAVAAEQNLREHLADLAQHQERRQKALAAIAPRRKECEGKLAELGRTLDDTRTDRVLALAEEPPAQLAERLGQAPSSPAGRAVWCHHALAMEAALDQNDGATPSWTGQSEQLLRAHQEITVAGRLLETSSSAPDPTEWAKLAGRAGSILDEAYRNVMAQTAIDRLVVRGQGPRQSAGVENTAVRLGPGLSL
jgi:hypothetical protein